MWIEAQVLEKETLRSFRQISVSFLSVYRIILYFFYQQDKLETFFFLQFNYRFSAAAVFFAAVFRQPHLSTVRRFLVERKLACQKMNISLGFFSQGGGKATKPKVNRGGAHGGGKVV